MHYKNSMKDICDMKKSSEKKTLPTWFWWVFWVSWVATVSIAVSLSWIAAACLTCLQVNVISLLATPQILLGMHGNVAIIFGVFNGICVITSMVLVPYTLWNMYITKSVQKELAVIIACIIPITPAILAYTYLLLTL